jgi:hypothetical protein
MKISSPKLPLTPKEKVQLKTCKINLKEIPGMDISHLSKCLQTSFERTKYLRGLAQFQLIPSIGPKVAQRVIDLGYYSLEEIQNEDGADLINRLESLYGYWEDPCVEDSLRCIVHYAKHPDSEKSWFDFSEERKRYRQEYGYPIERPQLAWHEVKK